LFRIAGNAAIDRRRREGVREMEELDAPAESADVRRVDLLIAEGADPERASAAREAGTELDRHLATLDARQRTAVLLRHQQGLSYPEVARAMGVAEGTAKTLVHRGVIVLRAAMKDWKPLT
jgi:RNA polymerase sigma-70 factor (ECF subfamily)